MLAGLIWLVLGGAALYAAAWWNGAADMRLFCLLWIMAWPVITGFFAGWHKGQGGFAAGARALLWPVFFLGLVWWWLAPEVWNAFLWAKFALVALPLAAFFGGLSVGIKQARPTPPENEEKAV